MQGADRGPEAAARDGADPGGEETGARFCVPLAEADPVRAEYLRERDAGRGRGDGGGKIRAGGGGLAAELRRDGDLRQGGGRAGGDGGRRGGGVPGGL